jgi:hypothetical protein
MKLSLNNYEKVDIAFDRNMDGTIYQPVILNDETMVESTGSTSIK